MIRLPQRTRADLLRNASSKSLRASQWLTGVICRDQNRFQRTAAEELDGPISSAVPWCGVEVTRVRVLISVLSLQLPIYRKYFGTSLTPRYELLTQKQSTELELQARQSLTCTLEWANDTRQRSQDLVWQITPRDSPSSTATVTLALRSREVVKNGNDWQLEAIFAGFRARIRGPLRVRLARANATGEHVLLDVTLSDTCWHQSVTPFTLEHTAQHETLAKLGELRGYYYEPDVNHCLTLAADTSVTPATPRLELTFLTVSQMTELLRYEILAMIARANVATVRDGGSTTQSSHVTQLQSRHRPRRCSVPALSSFEEIFRSDHVLDQSFSENTCL